MTSFGDSIHGRNVLIYGLGLQGGASGDAAFCVGHGSRVRVTDKKTESELAKTITKLPPGVELSLGGHSEADITWADYVIKNPGVPDDEPLLIRAREAGKPVYTSIALLVQEFRDRTIGVTGTRGKSTTTELIFRLLNMVYPGEVMRGGNIPGTSGLALLDEAASARYIVLELSSFQLAAFHELRVSPHISVVTNLYPDHLNRYNSMAAYLRDKQGVAAYQTSTDICIYNQDNVGAGDIARVGQGKKITYTASTITGWPSSLPGAHNRENIAAMAALAKELGIEEQVAQKLAADFSGLPYRQETIREVRGVTYINDTTATTPTATIKAIEAATSPFVLIFGGDTKGLPYGELMKIIGNSEKLQKIVILGSAHIPDAVAALRAVAGDKIVGTATSMQEAVQLATASAHPGWSVLLSPGFASFDLFENEFDRGRQFNEIVRAL